MSKTEKGFSVQEIAAHATNHGGFNNPVHAGTVSKLLHEVRGFGGQFKPTDKFSNEEKIYVSEYLAKYYRKRNSISISEWIEEEKSGKYPKEYKERSVVKTKTEKEPVIDPKDFIKTRAFQNAVKNAVAEYVKSNDIRGLLTESEIEKTDNQKRQREKDLEPLHKKIKSFIFQEPVTPQQTWKWLQILFEKRNGIKVHRPGEQTFPQWLHSSGWLDTFMKQLQGYLDYIHDEVNGQGALGL